MARQDTEFLIKQGPSKLDLVLSLFDTDMGERTVRFQIEDGKYDWIDVQIISVKRRHPRATTWDIEGIVLTSNHGAKRVSIHYLSDTREGSIRFEEGLQTHGVMETPDDARRAKALMIIINKMIARYQNSHRGNLDEEIFVLFEKAKRVRDAEDSNSLQEAIKEI